MRRALTLAYTDPVTRLPNRLRFVSRLDAAVAGGQGLFLIICDLDRFRQINVTFGPRVADMALATVAERLRASASPPRLLMTSTTSGAGDVSAPSPVTEAPRSLTTTLAP